MNITALSGRLATDVKFRITSNDKHVANFLLACPYSFKKNRDGYYPASFIPVTVWNELADNCNKYLKKGRSVSLSGHILPNDYTLEKFKNESGEPVQIRSLKVTAERIEFLGYRKQDRNGNPKEDNETPSPQVGMPDISEMEINSFGKDGSNFIRDLDVPDEEIPF